MTLRRALGFRRSSPEPVEASGRLSLEDETSTQDDKAPALVIFAVSVFLVAGLILAAVTTVDEVILARGRTASTGLPIIIQPLETSVLKEIRVREGDVVRTGDLLATLDPTFAVADRNTLDLQLQSLQATVARLDAELTGQPLGDLAGNTYAAEQLAVLSTRTAEFKAKLGNYDDRIKTLRARADRERAEAVGLGVRTGVMSEIEAMRATLEKQQTGSRLNRLQAQSDRMQVELQQQLSAQQSEIMARELASLASERELFVAEWRAAAAKELFDTQVRMNTISGDLRKASRKGELVELRAPADGVVLELAKASAGAVLESGRVLMRLVPSGSNLEIEADVETSDHGLVRIGDPAIIKFDAFPSLRYGDMYGRVRVVSEDALNPPQGADSQRQQQLPARYIARVEITEGEILNLRPGFRFVPGMPVSVHIVVGQRTLLSYFATLIRGITDVAFTEP